MNTAINDTILIFENNGQVEHCFCTEAQAKERLHQSKEVRSGGSMFTSDGMDADFVFTCAPNIRERVEVAKQKLRRGIAIRDALDSNGVPKDQDLRIAIYRSITELQQTVLRPVC